MCYHIDNNTVDIQSKSQCLPGRGGVHGLGFLIIIHTVLDKKEAPNLI